MRNILSSTQCQSLTKMTWQHCVWQDALVSFPSFFRALDSNNPVHSLRKMLCSTLHYAPAASLWMHPFLYLEVLLQVTSEKFTSTSLNSASLHSTTFPWFSESSMLSRSSNSHWIHSLPGDSLQSWPGRWASLFWTIEHSLCCISWGPHRWPDQSEIAVEERGWKCTETKSETWMS